MVRSLTHADQLAFWNLYMDYPAERKKGVSEAVGFLWEHVRSGLDEESGVTEKPPIEERKRKFADEVAAHVGLEHKGRTFTAEIAEAFVDYWTETNKTTRVMPFEKKATFNVGLRIRTWLRNGYGMKPTQKRVSIEDVWKA